MHLGRVVIQALSVTGPLDAFIADLLAFDDAIAVTVPSFW
jgi:hypothetical protein